MIHIFCGNSSQIHGHFAILKAKQVSVKVEDFLTRAGAEFLPANLHLRSLLAQVRVLIGDQAFETILEKHRVSAAYLLSKVRSRLTPEEHEQFQQLGTDVFSSTSHNWFSSSFIVNQWAALLHELLVMARVPVLIPRILKTSGTFIAVLKRMLIDHRCEGLDFFIGFDTQSVDSVIDVHGVRWDHVDNRSLFTTLAMFKSSAVFNLDDSPHATFEPRASFATLDPLDGAADRSMVAVLRTGMIGEKTLRTAMQVLDEIFSSYDFTASLQFALAILPFAEQLDQSNRARLHAAIAISANNRQFESERGGAAFNEFLEHHLQAAMRYETNPLFRSVIAYRMAVTLARREKKSREAIELIDRHLGELASLPLGRPRAYHEAWLLNIRAYACSLQKDSVQAAADVERAFELADTYWNTSPDVTPSELYTSQLFAGNRATLALYSHDKVQLQAWFDRGTTLFESQWDVGKRYVRVLRVKLHRDDHALLDAVRSAEEGLADAQHEHSGEYTDFFLISLADLHFRLGNLEAAQHCAEQALAFYQKVLETRRVRTVRLLLGAIARQRGAFEEAERILSDLEATGTPHAAESADLCSARALIHAEAGNIKRAEELLNAASATAYELGERDTIALVLRRAGESLKLAGQANEALAAFERCLEVARIEHHRRPLPNYQLVHVLLERCQLDPTESRLRELLEVLPKALIDDGELWWKLPTVIQLCDAYPQVDGREVLRIASQREDCARMLEVTRVEPLDTTVQNLLSR